MLSSISNKMRKYKPYLLLELLIAFFLLSQCLLPFIERPLNMLKKQHADLEKEELQRLAQNLFVDFKQKLYTNEIPWDKFEQSYVEQSPSSFKIYEKEFTSALHIKKEKDKKGREGQTYRLISVDVVFKQKNPPKKAQEKGKKHKFTYKVFAQCN